MERAGGLPQLRLSLVVSTQKGDAMVPHCVVPPVQEKMQVPILQMVMADGSVGHTLPQLPLHAPMSRQRPGSSDLQNWQLIVPGLARIQHESCSFLLLLWVNGCLQSLTKE